MNWFCFLLFVFLLHEECGIFLVISGLFEFSLCVVVEDFWNEKVFLWSFYDNTDRLIMSWESPEIMEKVQCWNSSVAKVKRRPKSHHWIFFNFLKEIDIFRRLFIKFFENLHIISIHIVSKNIMVHKGLRITVFLSEGSWDDYYFLSPACCFNVQLNQKFLLKSYWCVLNMNAESIEVSKPGLWVKIRQSNSKISNFFWLNSCKIVIFWKHRIQKSNHI